MKYLRRNGSTLALFILFFGWVGCIADGQHQTQEANETRTSEGSAAPGEITLPQGGLSDRVAQELDKAFKAYEEMRALLAQDRMDSLKEHASALSFAMQTSAKHSSEAQLRRVLEEAARTADSLGETKDLQAARVAFGEVSRFLVFLAGSNPKLSEGRYVFECVMTQTFNKWIQTTSQIENPFMGQAMPSCGTASDWTVPPPQSSVEVAAHSEYVQGAGGEDDIAHYTCSMHPSVQRQEPGTCPICSMDLVPVTRKEMETGVITIDAQRRQLIGVRTTRVTRQEVHTRIRAIGKVVYDETRLADVTLKYRGWIGELKVNQTGQKVEKGQILFDLYSPVLYAAQEEFLAAIESQRAARSTSEPKRADYLVDAARQRLHLWDIHDRQIDAIARTGRPLEYIPIVSPASGYVVEKNVVQGAAVEPRMKLYRIAGLQTVWIEAEVYESELPFIEIGQQAEVTLPYLPGRKYEGRITFLYPYLDDRSRTARLRIELENSDMALKPDMYANVEIQAEWGERLMIPEEAVLYAGPRHLVFVDLGKGRLKPQEIKLGVRSGDYYEVLSGLEEGDVVVTSGNFLVAAESRLKSATEQW